MRRNINSAALPHTNYFFNNGYFFTLKHITALFNQFFNSITGKGIYLLALLCFQRQALMTFKASYARCCKIIFG